MQSLESLRADVTRLTVEQAKLQVYKKVLATLVDSTDLVEAKTKILDLVAEEFPGSA